MLNVERLGGQLQITAECYQCGQPLVNPAEATLAYKTLNEPRPRLLHQQTCLKTFKQRHPKNWKFIRAGKVFAGLGY